MRFCLKFILSAIVVFASFYFFPASAAVSACYKSVCYSSLGEAEAALRADAQYGQYYRQKDSTVGRVRADSLMIYVNYEVDDQPPAHIFPPGYIIAGWAVDSLGCAPSEGDPRLCSEEEPMVAAFRERHLRLFRDYNCTIRNEAVLGSYAIPFNRITSAWKQPGHINTTQSTVVGESHRWEFEVNCPGWGHPDFSLRQFPIYKEIKFTCPSGFSVKTGYAPGYEPPGSTQVVEWPNLCFPQVRRAQIQVTTTSQVASCGTSNPCHPSTGDKSRAEVDFQFAGQNFVRSYHSLRELNSGAGIGAGWTHSYEERLGFYYSTPVLLTGGGYYETFDSLGDGLFRAKNTDNKVLELLANGQYQLRDGSGGLKTFSSDGRLLSVADLSQPARSVALEYADGRLSRVVDAQSRAIEFVYENGLLSGVVLPDGSSVVYHHDSSDNLTAVDYGAGAVKQYHYNESGLASSGLDNHMTGITSEDGRRYATFSYDGLGRVLSSHLHGDDGLVDGVSLEYKSGTEVDLTTSIGDIRHYVMQPGLYRRILSVSDGRGSLEYDYDGAGRLQTQTSVDGVVRAFAYEDTYLASRTVTSPTGEVTRTSLVRNDDNAVTRTEMDTFGEGVWHKRSLRTFAYNQDGRIAGECQLDPALPASAGYTCGSSDVPSSGVRQFTYSYCDQGDVDSGVCPLAGLIKESDGPRIEVSDSTTYQYYAADHPDCATSSTTCAWRKGDLWKVTNALGQVTETLRYDGAGRPLSVKDPNGVITDFEYHPRGWLTARKVRGADDSVESDDAITRIDYYPTGLVSSVTLPDGSFTSYVYDAAHRLTDIVDADGNRIHYTLDNAGNRTAEEVFDESDTLLRTMSRVYNQLGQLQVAKDAGNHPTAFTYDLGGNTDTVTDALGRVTDNDHDPLDRLVRTLQDVGGIEAETRFEYDALDNLTRVTDPKGLDTEYTYNAFGDLTRLESPDTGVTTYEYDAAGNRTRQTDARGEVVDYSYDALNRLTGISYSDSALDVAYSYDSVQASCGSNETFAVGRLVRMDDGSGHTEYCFNRFGHMTRKVQVTNGQSFTLRYAYTRAGQLSAMTYPDGTVIDYVRDGLGRTTEIGVTEQGATREVLLQGAAYYPFGPASGWTYGNGRTLTRSFDQDYRPQSILSTGSGAGGLDLGFGWDAVGNLGSLHGADLAQPARITLDYDALNRLTHFRDGPTGTAIESYSYDATGNRTSFTNAGGTQTYAYPTDSHHLTAVGATPRNHDAAGNTVAIGGTAREFAYNAAGRMSEVQRDNAIAMQYAYSGRGEQVRRHLGGTSTYTLYDETGHWVGDYDSSGSPIQQAIWLDDLPVGVLAGTAAASNRLHYIEPDHLGTPRAVIEPQRDVAVWAWDIASEAFGNSYPDQNPDGDTAAFAFSMRFPGQRYDAASGLGYNYYRDGYDASTGRYTQSDPVGLMAGVSTYGYVSGSPLVWFDMYGLLQWTTTPIVWSPTLVPGLQTRTFPGDGVSTVTGSSAARTTLDWSISSACTCAVDGYSLDEYKVNFIPIVFLRQRYDSFDQKRDSRRAELDHVRDFNRWIGGARTAAQALEDSMKGQSFAGAAECENAAQQAMQKLLQAGARQTAIDSHNRWDASGRHTEVILGP